MKVNKRAFKILTDKDMGYKYKKINDKCIIIKRYKSLKGYFYNYLKEIGINLWDIIRSVCLIPLSIIMLVVNIFKLFKFAIPVIVVLDEEEDDLIVEAEFKEEEDK